ncbi:ABC transporter substrate-binding protein [Neomicrococcus lactis]|uniref:NitT/TauT family transport system substrate-binding protein n=1 Tax=Neomicrococcus lactis TaxID=732241 RepID=A0A7W8YC45_9MICC|nr:ABC transporter substrate-binding protein [Neomicrococcus lactis]MBB5598525.1 NitT/TauT family transport system substrate-binding protein [Neomicrococcus lactis]
MKRLHLALAALAISSLSLVGCGAGSPSAASGSGGTSTSASSASSSNSQESSLKTLRVAAVPVVDVAALYIGEKQGFFNEKGLKLDIKFTAGSSVAIPAMMQDQFDVVYSGSVNALQAREKGLPIVAVAEGGRTTGVQGKDHGGIVVPKDSPIKTAKDLEGHSLAVNAVKGLHEAADRASVLNAGGDPSKVKFLELPLTDMAATMKSGNVDAISTSEPFLTLALEDGNRLIASPFVDVSPEFVTAVYMTSEQKLSADQQTYRNFNEALKKSQEYALEHADEFRAELGNFTSIDPEVAKKMTLTNFGWGFPEDAMKAAAEASKNAGIINDVDASLNGLVARDIQ